MRQPACTSAVLKLQEVRADGERRAEAVTERKRNDALRRKQSLRLNLHGRKELTQVRRVAFGSRIGPATDQGKARPELCHGIGQPWRVAQDRRDGIGASPMRDA